MNESGDQQQQRVGSSMNPKIASDSGYGSNKSTQRSSGSSKSHESSVSSESSTAYPPHPDAPISIAECQSASPGQGGSSTKRQGKKKKGDRKLSLGEKAEARLSTDPGKDSSKSGALPQSMDQIGSSPGNAATTPTGSQQQLSQSQIMSPASRASSTHDSKALQMAALTHALSCMKKFHKPMTDSEINEGSERMETIPGKKWQEYFSTDINIDDSSNEDTFASVVSLDDGIVVYITPSISNILGFPKDMLVGRSFIDFVHPKDKMAFASHITCGMSFPMSEQHSPQSQGTNTNASTGAARVKSEPFYCRLRQYRGLKTVGFGVVDKSVHYYPFKLTMTLKKVEQHSQKDGNGILIGGTTNCSTSGPTSNTDESSRQGVGTDDENSNNDSSPTSGLMNESNTGGGCGNEARQGASPKKSNFVNSDAPNTTVHLVIVANRIKSAYQFPDETPTTPGKFVTRHSASCHFGHMDSEAINYLGHLPQDLIGNSVLDYYHPEDMPLMKDIYEGVMQEQGKPFRSKPYRFRVYNGTFAMLETDWSCFINPWSWKLEFVIGQHRVIKGPGNPNVFMQPNEETDYAKKLSDEVLDDSKDRQNEIKRLLTEVRKTAVKTVTRRLSDPLRQQSSRRRKDLAALMESLLEGMVKTENSDKSGSQCSGMFSVMERDSVMLGEISPHHDDQSGSNQSSETPPSYNQLNYRENIERFFQSQPKTVRSDESAENGKVEATQSVNRSSDSDSKSSPNADYSSGSNVRLSSGGSNENESGDRDLCASPLTEERLSRHNEAMEKYMIQRHRELRVRSSMTPGSHKESRHRHSEKAETSHGLKRTGNASWDGDTHTAKHPHLECPPGRNPAPMSGTTPGVCCPGHNTINLWPPFSITMTPGITTSTYRETTAAYPVYHFFANLSSAGAAAAPAPGSTPAATFPGLSQCFNTNRPGGTLTTASGNFVPETISMSATTPSAPMLFLPNQHHHHHQFVPQQVQLFPSGVVYQPLGSCMYGQPSSFMMPAGFLGTMVHPSDQTVINQLESSSAQLASQGEAIGIASLPKVAEKDKAGMSCAKSMKNPGKHAQGKYASNLALVGPSKPGPSEPNGRKSHPMSHRLVKAVNRAAVVVTSVKSSVIPGSSPAYQHRENMIGLEGSGSDESMNSSSVNTSEDKGSQSYSDQDLWASREPNEDQDAENSASACDAIGAVNKPKPIRNKQPPWLEQVQVTPDLMYRYRLPAGDLSDILRKDLEALKIFGKQSTMVNDQLGMLYSELNVEGCAGITLNLEEGTASNSSSGDENAKESGESRKTRKPVASHQYRKMVILYEENAPFPPEATAAVPKGKIRQMEN